MLRFSAGGFDAVHTLSVASILAGLTFIAKIRNGNSLQAFWAPPPSSDNISFYNPDGLQVLPCLGIASLVVFLIFLGAPDVLLVIVA
jgi:hypothetical protein